ncbi:MAG: DsbA family protein, partial [Planctomycetota bacterium]|nr:DsbA family protein [Planctomycetota bacterium]
REKYIEDWRQKPNVPMQPEKVEHALGEKQSRLEIIVWGDYMGDATAKVDRMIQGIMQGRDDVWYVFRHYPVNQQCNSRVTAMMHEFSCEASMAVEAAGVVGGEDAYWNMHNWMFAHQENFTLDSISEGAQAIGLNPQDVLSMMQDIRVSNAIRDDIDSGSVFRPRSIPNCFINGKHVPRPFFGDDCIIDDIASEVLGEDVRQN